MSDEPLDPATLDALRSALQASPPGVDSDAWEEMLRRALDSPAGVDVHGDVAADALVPANWPDPASDVGADDRAGSAHESDGAQEASFAGDEWGYAESDDDRHSGHAHDQDDGGHDQGGE